MLALALIATVPATASWASSYWHARVATASGEQKDTEPPTRRIGTSGQNETVISGPNFDTYVHIPVDVPDGATITEVLVYGDDNVATSMSFWFRYSYYSTESYTTVSSWSSTNTLNVWTTSTISLTTDNDNYAYWITVGIPYGYSSDLRVWTVEVEYTP